MNRARRCLLSVLCALSLGSCVALPGDPAGEGGAPAGVDPFAHPAARERPEELPPLYSRAGGVVEAQEPGSVVGGAPSSHGMDLTEQGRQNLLEILMATNDERDALRDEVDLLRLARDRMEEDLELAYRELETHSAELARLERELADMGARNHELASRLVTAQIRRLEAEKILLESKIEEVRGGGSPPEGDGRLAPTGMPGPPAAPPPGERPAQPAASSSWDLALEDQP